MVTSFLFVGERLCVDFVNTEMVEAGERVDRLRRFEDLVEWCVQAQVLGAADAKPILRRWADTAEGRQAFERAIAFRATLRTMLEGLADGMPQVAPRIVEALNAELRLGASECQVARTTDGYALRVRRIVDAPGRLLPAVAESAAALLTADDLALVKGCQNPDCVLFFYDTTKNHARRWCSMAACGNRAKVAAHYRRGRRLEA